MVHAKHTHQGALRLTLWKVAPEGGIRLRGKHAGHVEEGAMKEQTVEQLEGLRAHADAGSLLLTWGEDLMEPCGAAVFAGESAGKAAALLWSAGPLLRFIALVGSCSVTADEASSELAKMTEAARDILAIYSAHERSASAAMEASSESQGSSRTSMQQRLASALQAEAYSLH